MTKIMIRMPITGILQNIGNFCDWTIRLIYNKLYIRTTETGSNQSFFISKKFRNGK